MGNECLGCGRAQRIVAQAVLDGRARFTANELDISRTTMMAIAQQSGMQRVPKPGTESYFTPGMPTWSWARGIIARLPKPRETARKRNYVTSEQKRIKDMMRNATIREVAPEALSLARSVVASVVRGEVQSALPQHAGNDALALAKAAAESGLVLVDARACCWARRA